MKKDENIYIKLGLEKDVDTGKIFVNILFDKDAPNYCQDKSTPSWCPTLEEWEYANEAYAIMNRGQPAFAQKITTTTPKTQTEKEEPGFVEKYLEKKPTH